MSDLEDQRWWHIIHIQTAVTVRHLTHEWCCDEFFCTATYSIELSLYINRCKLNSKKVCSSNFIILPHLQNIKQQRCKCKYHFHRFLLSTCTKSWKILFKSFLLIKKSLNTQNFRQVNCFCHFSQRIEKFLLFLCFDEHSQIVPHVLMVHTLYAHSRFKQNQYTHHLPMGYLIDYMQ